MKLEQPIELSDGIQTICLPTKDSMYEDMTATVVGWGVTEKGKQNLGFGANEIDLICFMHKQTNFDSFHLLTNKPLNFGDMKLN